MNTAPITDIADRLRKALASSPEPIISVDVVDLRALLGAVDAVTELAAEWRDRHSDYDEGTEQQIADGLAITKALGIPCPHRWRLRASSGRDFCAACIKALS